MTSPAIPDAVAAAIQGVLDDHPAVERSALGRLIVRELSRDGWVVSAVPSRATTGAVDTQRGAGAA